MKQLSKLSAIGLIGGIVLILILKIVFFITGNPAYVLLFNFDYIPVIKDLRPIWLFGYIFHFATCIISVIALFYLLKFRGWDMKILPYIVVYTLGGGVLFFLTALSLQPPSANDGMAWIYWTFGHAMFGYVVGVLIQKWI